MSHDQIAFQIDHQLLPIIVRKLFLIEKTDSDIHPTLPLEDVLAEEVDGALLFAILDEEYCDGAEGAADDRSEE